MSSYTNNIGNCSFCDRHCETVWLGLGTETTWQGLVIKSILLRLGKDHGLDQNKYVSYISLTNLMHVKFVCIMYINSLYVCKLKYVNVDFFVHTGYEQCPPG